MPTSEQLQNQLDRLARFEPTGAPVVSLYLNAQPGPTGRDAFEVFVRREFKERGRTYPAHSPERESLDKDFARIEEYLARDLEPAANGVAVFASSASGGFFEGVQLAAPIDEHWLYIGDRPQLYPLARIDAQHPRYAAVLLDTSAARIFVFATGELVGEHEVKGQKTRGRGGMGGWSQTRYQRRIENAHRQLAREVVEHLDRLVREEDIPSIILAGDEVALPLIKAELPKHLQEKVIDDLHLPAFAPAHEVLSATVGLVEQHDATTDREKVAEALAGYRSSGLGSAGPAATLEALQQGQVDELLIAATLQEIRSTPKGTAVSPPEVAHATIERGGADVTGEESAPLAGQLVALARQTGARVTFIEDADLLREVGGVAAILRFRI